MNFVLLKGRHILDSKHFDILLWIDLTPNKLGSFEQYFFHQVRVCREHGLKVFAVFAEGMSSDILRLIESEGIRHSSYPCELMHSSQILRYEMDRTKCRLVHFHFFSICSNLYRIVRLKGCRVLVTHHFSITEKEYNEEPWWMVRLRRKFCSAFINRTIAVSEFIQKYLENRSGLSKNKITVVLNGVDTNKYQLINDHEKKSIRKSLGIKDNAVLITYVGQIADFKGINELILAIKILEKTDILFTFAFIGNGPLEQALISAGKNILFLGRRNDVNTILAASDIFVAPSAWYEAFGFTIAEASACGVPVVTTNVGGIPEIIKDGVTGYVVPVRAPKEIASKLESLALDKELRLKMGMNGSELVKHKFTVERMANETYNVYRDMLN